MHNTLKKDKIEFEMEFDGSPIDLSTKPRNDDIDNKKIYASPRPLPELIPISMLIENTENQSTSDNDKCATNTQLKTECFNVSEKSVFPSYKKQLKEKSSIKGLMRFRSVPQLSNRPRVLQQMKCRSESRIPFTSEQNINLKSKFMINNSNDNNLLKPYDLFHKIVSHAEKNTSEMAVMKNLQMMDVNKTGISESSSCSGGMNFSKSVPQDQWKKYNTLEWVGSYLDHDSDDGSSSPFYDSLKQKEEGNNKELEERMYRGISPTTNQYMKNGPGVSLDTLHSLRKLLDRRKSVQKENVT